MSKAVIIRKSASELRVGDRIMETDGGGLWYHIATVVKATYAPTTSWQPLGTTHPYEIVAQSPRDAGDVVFTRRYRSSALFNVEVIV